MNYSNCSCTTAAAAAAATRRGREIREIEALCGYCSKVRSGTAGCHIHSPDSAGFIDITCSENNRRAIFSITFNCASVPTFVNRL